MRSIAVLALAACAPHARPPPPPPAQHDDAAADRFASLRAELKKARGPREITLARARLADALWDASCPSAEARLCVAHGTAPGGHLYCSGDHPPMTTTATPRGPE